MRRILLACSLGVAVVFAGCLGRTGIGLDELGAPVDETAGDAAVDTGVTIVEAGVDSTVPDTAVPKEDAPGVDRFIDIWDVFPIPESGVIGECAGCVRDKCGSSVNQCINSEKCRNGLACVATRCLTGAGGGGGTGGIDFKCLNDCFGGDFAAAGLAITTFTCVLNNCGAKCGGILGGGEGGLPGIPGFPGSGFAGGFEYSSFERDPSFHLGFSVEAYSPWRRELDQAACEQGLQSCPK